MLLWARLHLGACMKLRVDEQTGARSDSSAVAGVVLCCATVPLRVLLQPGLGAQAELSHARQVVLDYGKCFGELAVSGAEDVDLISALEPAAGWRLPAPLAVMGSGALKWPTTFSR